MSLLATFTVSELTNEIKKNLEGGFSSFEVKGEITNFRPHSSGHLYFDLKDQGAKIPVVLFRRERGTLSNLPKEGDSVQVIGSLSVYPPHGKYQIIAKSMRLVGVGELLQKLEELKNKLRALGWFDPEKKKPLPSFPKTIGVVTSPTGAVIRDIINVLSRRFSGFHLILNPVRVQGEGAAQEIAAAIEQFNAHKLADVLIIGRGGGSLEDLWPFNEEIVAKAVFESDIPVVSAVGHETDVALSDYVADLRAPTPSAAAEMVVSEKARHSDFLKKAKLTALRSLQYQVKHIKTNLLRYQMHPLLSSPKALLAQPMQRLDELKTLLDQKMHTLVEKRGLALKGLAQNVEALNPKKVLKRGYSILFDKNEKQVISSVTQLKPSQPIQVTFSDGEADLQVVDS